MAPNLTAKSGYQFLSRTMTRRFDGHVNLVQTDGGPEFKAEFKKNEQSYIESFNRTIRKECLGWRKYGINELFECANLVESFLIRYHYHRPHMGLKMRPPLLINPAIISRYYDPERVRIGNGQN